MSLARFTRTDRDASIPHIVFWTAMAGLLVFGWYYYRAALDARESSAHVRHSYDVLLAIASLEAQLAQAESAQRGFLASGQPAFVLQRDAAITSLKDTAQQLTALTGRDAAQARRSTQLDQRLNERVALMRETVRPGTRAPGPAATPDVFARAQRLTAAIHDLSGDMQRAEWTFLREHALVESARYERAMLLILAVFAAAALVVLPGYAAFIMQSRARRRTEIALREAKEIAEGAARAKSTFLAVMSHEIRTPLNGVLGMLELLSLGRLEGDQRRTLNVVCESGRALQRIIDDILDFSRIEAGRLEISPELCSIREVIAGTRNIYAGNASSKGLLLTTSVDPRVSPAHVVDPLRLQQILNNLVSNAIKFTPSGMVEVRADLMRGEATTETVRFSVRDTGIGMSREAQSRLFQPFVQATAETARGYGGSGLGLTICKRLAEMMGGSMEVDSAAGRGATIHVTLPLPVGDPTELAAGEAARRRDAPAFAAPARTAPEIDEAEEEGTLVLVVDDHPTNRLLLRRQIQTLGYAAETAENGADALRKLEARRYGALFTDCNMPELDGYELTRRVRAAEQSGGRTRMPVIACTANALRGEAEACLAAGMDDYLAKPVQLAELNQKLVQWVPLPPPRQSLFDGAAGAVIDESALAALAGDATAVHEILEQFAAASRSDAETLEEAVRAGDLAESVRRAHRMKGASRMVGAQRLAAACERIEHAGRAGDFQAIRREMDELTLELERIGERLAGSPPQRTP